MSQMKHLMDTVANELGIIDPNDPRVRAECQRRLYQPDQTLENQSIKGMTLLEAVKIYDECEKVKPGKCDTCRLDNKKFIEDKSICGFLWLAEERARRWQQ